MNQRVDEHRAINESRLDRLERISLEKDLIISGVPLENNDDPFIILGDICNAINCNLKQEDFVSAYRLSSNKTDYSNKRILPIVVRIQHDWVKNEFLTAYFRKKNQTLDSKHQLAFMSTKDSTPRIVKFSTVQKSRT